MSLVTHPRADMCYCPGCSHGVVLEQLGRAIDSLAWPSDRVCVVSDIGCIGTADRYFSCHTFHGLHGRSITYAEGIKRFRPELNVIVLIGDGGCGIGTAHLVHAARRDAGIKVIVCNNFNFGMTGGQHSPTTPDGLRTTTTPEGAGEHAFDLCRTVAVNGAAYAARFQAFDPALTEHFRQALAEPGFALVDVWEMCTAYLVPANHMDRKSLGELSTRLDLPFGVIARRAAAAPADVAARADAPPVPVDRREAAASPPSGVTLGWPARREICVAGSAGQHIRTAVGAIGEIAVAAGLFAAQQDDFPITVRRGFSISNLIVAADPIRYTGLDDPDLIVLLSRDGRQRIGDPSQLRSSSLIVAASDVPVGDTDAAVRLLELGPIEKRVGKASLALAVLSYALVAAGWIDGASLCSVAASALSGPYRSSNLQAISAGVEPASMPSLVPAVVDELKGG